MAGSAPRGIRKRLNTSGQPRYQVRYLVRDANSSSGWVETSSTFATLREARAFKADRDREAANGGRRFDPRLGRFTLTRIWEQFALSKKPAVSPDMGNILSSGQGEAAATTVVVAAASLTG